MFFLLSKVLAFLIAPVDWVAAMLVIAFFSKDERRRKKLLGWSLVLFLFFSNSFILDEFMRKWEVPATPYVALQPVYDAGIVMSGMINYDQSFNRLQFNRRNDRLMQAIELYKMGRIKKLVFSGGSGSLLHPDKKESLMVKRFLTTIGIPEEDILIEAESDNTHENALFTKPILEKNFPGGKFLVITTASHMRRTLGCFKKQGMQVTPYSVDRVSGPRKFEFDHLLIPSAETMFDWNSLTHEVFGVIVYKIMGYC